MAKNESMGHNVRKTLSENRELAIAYDTYKSCREQHIVTYEESKGKGKTVLSIRPYTVGWSALPAEGGILDQPHRLFSFLEIFLTGDRMGFYLDKR